MFGYILLIIVTGFTLGTCACGIAFGGKAERTGSICILAANVAAEVFIYLQRPVYPAQLLFMTDLALAIALLVIAIRYSSLWLGGAMLLQSIALYTHSLEMSGSDISHKFYVDANNDLTLAMMVCILVGTTFKIRERRRERSLPAPVPVAGL